MLDPSFINIRGDWSRLFGLVRALSGIRCKHAAVYHDEVADLLIRQGWQVKREFPVLIGDGAHGMVDIVADRDGCRIALELDNRTPRGKSLVKLATFPAGVLTAVLLRNPKTQKRFFDFSA